MRSAFFLHCPRRFALCKIGHTAFHSDHVRLPADMGVIAKLKMSVLAVIARIMATNAVLAQTPAPTSEYSYPPLSYRWHKYYEQHPEEFQQLLESRPRVSHEIAPTRASPQTGGPVAGTWTALTNPAGVNLMNPLLLTDGTVIAHVSCSSAWYKLTPDNTGGYISGTWSQIASTVAGYGPRFFGSAVLPDGRVIIEGGEYNASGCTSTLTTQGAIYDPVANTWTPVSPPAGWSTIGDAAGIVLANGTYMQTSCCDNPAAAALLNPATLAWTATGTGKFDVYDEEAMALLPNGTVLTVDAYVGKSSCGQGSEIYNPATGTWTSAGNVGNQQSDCNSPANSKEVGPLVMRPDGTAVSFSGVTNNSSPIAIYDSTTGHWLNINLSVGSIGGVPYTLADAPASVLPSGNILFSASPANWTAPNQFPRVNHYFEMSIADNSITQVPDRADSATFSSFQQNLLVLPTGQVMAFTIDGPTVEIYTCLLYTSPSPRDRQ